MCRSSSEGGRRCPHDSSSARQARRLKQQFESYPSGAQSNPLEISSSRPVFSSVHEGKNEVNMFISNVKKQVELKAYPMTAEDGKEFHNVNDFLAHSGVILENKICRLGATIVAEVENSTGVTFDSIVEDYNKHVIELTLQTDSLMVEEETLLKTLGEHFGEKQPSRLTFDRLRLEVHNNPEDEKLNDFKNKLESIIERKEKLKKEVDATNYNYSENVREKYSTNIKTLMEALHKIRSFGGSLKTSSKSDKTKTETLEYAAQFYPTEWLEQSNHNPVELIVKNTNGRAHYTHWSKTAKVTPLYRLMYNDSEPEDMEGVIVVTADENGNVEYENKELGVNVRTYAAPNEKLYLAPQWEYPNPWTTRYNQDGSPKGYGWQPYKHHSTGATAWRRIIRQRKSTVDSSSANILVDNMVNGINNVRGFDSAIHELAHRMEAVEIPFLKHVQKAFYERRTTNNDGTKQNRTRLYKGRNEYSITDSFAADYMGKTYSGDIHYEILSTGMEAIFGGEYAGGLIGLKSKKPDKDMRDLIIGIIGGL
jgi:hypothetical protein